MVVSVEQLLSLPILWLLVVLALLLTRRRVLKAAAASSSDPRTVRLLARLYAPAGLLACAYLALEIVPLPQRWNAGAEKTLSVLTLIFALWAVWRAFALLLSYWGETNPNAATLIPPVQVAGRLLFAAVGIALALQGLGYSITKLWTALGIGSVAVALALQDTLSNTFAGFYIMLDQPVRVGDYVKLDSGEEGRVQRIGWRSTWLQALPNNLVVVPNSKLARASVTNYSLPDPSLNIAVQAAASYSSDPRRVCAVLEEVAREAAAELPGLLPDFPPTVAFSGFGDAGLNFALNCRVREFTAQHAVQNELRYRICERFRREGIEFPPAMRPG
jgi:small-conductance mechanosensitive channel